MGLQKANSGHLNSASCSLQIPMLIAFLKEKTCFAKKGGKIGLFYATHYATKLFLFLLRNPTYYVKLGHQIKLLERGGNIVRVTKPKYNKDDDHSSALHLINGIMEA